MHNRITLIVDLKLKKTFVSYFTQSPGVPSLPLVIGGRMPKNPYNGNPAYIIVGNQDETPEQLIERLNDGDMIYQEKERNVILKCLRTREYVKLVDWKEAE